MNICLHQTHHTIGDFEKILDYVRKQLTLQKNGLHLFPELFLTGYPLQDLCLNKAFMDNYLNMLQELNSFALSLKTNEEFCLLLGGLSYDLADSGLPQKIYNVIYQLKPGHGLEVVYTKRLLPNYDIFDERKYFSPGKSSTVLEWQNKKIALFICEDMWPSNFHDVDPVADLQRELIDNNQNVDLIVNLSASPYHLKKDQKRLARAQHIARDLQAPFVYLNKVGTEDEIIFDGQSFITTDSELIYQAPAFKEDFTELELPEMSKGPWKDQKSYLEENTWEELFAPHLIFPAKGLSELTNWSKENLEMLEKAISFAFQEYAQKNGFNRFLVALSGGLDSAMVLTLVANSLKEGQSVEALYMPSKFSSTKSYDLSYELCQKLKVSLKTLPIKFLHSAAKNAFGQSFSEPFEGLTDENIQSRLRGMLLYTRSNQQGAMVLNTSNKSELSVGYTTQYGDSVGAISLLGDLYKSEVYQLAYFLRDKYQTLPEGIITREPTAELREGQKDTESLPPYSRLDAILEGILSNRYSADDLCQLGFKREEVDKVYRLYQRSEFKRQQFCPIIKLKTKSYGFGYRVPISKSRNIYNDNRK